MRWGVTPRARLSGRGREKNEESHRAFKTEGVSPHSKQNKLLSPRTNYCPPTGAPTLTAPTETSSPPPRSSDH